MSEYLERLNYLIGEDNLNSLKDKNVLICGVGGVGSFVAEALSRSGIGKLTILDFDDIAPSNLNRQIMTTKENIGQSKVEELKKRINEISDCEVKTIKTFIDENIEFEDKYDYVIDCIDVIASKFELIKKAHENNIPIISALGAGKRIIPGEIILNTLDKTKNDPLAKAFRSYVRKKEYKEKIEVVYMNSEALPYTSFNEEGNTRKEKYPIGSSIFPVGSMGLYIASIVFNRLIDSSII